MLRNSFVRILEFFLVNRKSNVHNDSLWFPRNDWLHLHCMDIEMMVLKLTCWRRGGKNEKAKRKAKLKLMKISKTNKTFSNFSSSFSSTKLSQLLFSRQWVSTLPKHEHHHLISVNPTKTNNQLNIALNKQYKRVRPNDHYILVCAHHRCKQSWTQRKTFTSYYKYHHQKQHKNQSAQVKTVTYLILNKKKRKYF